MAKDYSCCGGSGRHLGGCGMQEQAEGTGNRRTRTPGPIQGRFLDSLKNGRQPATRGQAGASKAIDSMLDRGWVEKKPDGTLKITDAGQAAHELWRDN